MALDCKSSSCVDPWAEGRRLLQVASARGDISDSTFDAGLDCCDGAEDELIIGTELLARRAKAVTVQGYAAGAAACSPGLLPLRLVAGFGLPPREEVLAAIGARGSRPRSGFGQYDDCRDDCWQSIPERGLPFAPQGDVVEVLGASGAGKTQVGLSCAACCATLGHDVIFISALDAPSQLAVRLAQILSAGNETRLADAKAELQPYTAEDTSDELVAGSLRRVQLRSATSFEGLVAVLRHCEDLLKQRKQTDGDNGEGPSTQDPSSQSQDQKCSLLVPVFVFDGLSEMLSPFAATLGQAHRWRIAWVWRILRRLALDARVLVLSPAPSTWQGRGFASAQSRGTEAPAGMATTRFELTMEGQGVAAHLSKQPWPSPNGTEEYHLCLTSSWCAWGVHHVRLPLSLNDRGVTLRSLGVSAVAGGIVVR